jgi:diguanylate cyclase (GGDEF)-like protein/PAS domain S-box-containing protein
MKSLNTRAIVFFLAVFAIISSIGGGYLYFSTLANYALEKAHSDAEKQIALLRIQVTAHMKLRQNEVISMAGFEESKQALATKHSDAIDRANRLYKHLKQTLDAEVCYLMDSSGTTIASSNHDSAGSFVGENYAFRPYFKTAIKGLPWIYIASGITSKKRGVYFSAPVYSNNLSKVSGVMVLKAKPAALETHLGQFKNGLAVLASPNGLIFSASRKEYELMLLWQLPPEKIKKLVRSRQFGPGGWQWSGFTKTGKNVVTDKDGNEYGIHQTYMPKLVAWKIIFLHNLDEVTDKVLDDSFRMTRYIGLGICLAIGLLAFFLSRQAHLNILRREQMTEALLESEERFRGAFEAAAHGLALVAMDGRWLKVNKTISEILGYSSDELLATNFQAVTHPDDLNEDLDLVAKVTAGEISTYQLEKRYLHKDGHSIWAMLSVSLVKDVKGKPLYFVSQIVDISERKKLEQRLKEVSITDELTGLLNRRGFMGQAERQLSIADRLEGKIYLFYADLDNLKIINDQLGHNIGDQALGETADILRRTFRQADIISRIGGDEFAVLLTTRQKEDEHVVTARFEEEIKAANRANNRPYEIKVSFGIVKHNQSASHTIEELLRQADALMYQHKNKRKNANA